MRAEQRRVLILEDEPQTLKLLVDYLRSPHVELVACREIEAAECLMDREHFDVLVTDLEVSALGGLEGIRLVRHVTCHFPRTRVIVFSGNLSPEVRSLGEALGVVELLEKPAGLNRLRSLVDVGLPTRNNRPADRVGDVTRVETLEEVLRERSVTAVLQPIMALNSGESAPSAFGVEGLSRGPEGSPLGNPEILLGYASRKERLFEAEMLCIEAVLKEGCHLPRVGKLFINTRPRTVSQPRFALALRELVRLHGYDETDIVLELTEQQSILNLPAFDRALRELRDCGFGLALDDYGSGFANLHLVQQLPLDYLKIDGVFASEVDRSRRKQAIVHSTVEMAGDLGISTIMERVETEQELEKVRELGVTYAQGYFFSVPLSGRELAASFQPAPIVLGAPVALATGRNGDEPRFETKTIHELSNLLTGIALFANQSIRAVGADNPVQGDLHLISVASERAVELTAELHGCGAPVEWTPGEAEPQNPAESEEPVAPPSRDG
ncbi:MAG: EAL domain-containing protein [Thermoanaerobaculia bacterium]